MPAAQSRKTARNIARKTPRKKRTTTPTIRDVAALAKVSTATVSHVLNETGRAGAKARERVTAAIASLGYRPNGNAASLRNRRSRLIGLVLPTFTNIFFARMASEFERLANAEGFDIVTVTTDEDEARERERIEALMSRQMEALIIYPASAGHVGQGFLPRELPPTVLMDRAADTSGFDTVCLANRRTGEDVARHLAALGHRHVAIVIENEAQEPMRQRRDGVVAALSERGGHCRVIVSGSTIEGARGAVEQELRRQDRATAIIAASNVATLGAIKAVQGLQLAMPGDVTLVGYDDFDWMTALRPYVSAVAQPFEQLAQEAWALLMARLAANKTGASPPAARHVTVAGELRIRESSGSPAKPA